MSIIDDIIKREGSATNDPSDKGGRTQYGISERSNPAAWADGKVTREEAEAIYSRKYISGPGFDRVANDKLKAQLVDFGVTSGPTLAITKLQALLSVEQDGILGPKTLAAVNSHINPIRLNNELALERIKMIGRLVTKNPSQAKFASGWINRCIEFFL